MSQLMPAVVVDALPEGLWSLGNLYRFFGRDLHFCVSDGVRTIEIGGREVVRGSHPFPGFDKAENAETQLRRYGFDLGWLIVGAIALWIAVGVGAARLLRRPLP